MCVNEGTHVRTGVQPLPVPTLQVDLFREAVQISESRARQSPAFTTTPTHPFAAWQETCTKRRA